MSSKDQIVGVSFADLREVVKRQRKKGEKHIMELRPFMTSAEYRLLSNFRDANPEKWHETPYIDRILTRVEERALYQSIENGNVAKANYLTGRTDKQQDLSGNLQIQRLLGYYSIDDGFPIQYCFGTQGSAGKTHYSIVLAEVLYSTKNYQIGTNIPSIAKNKDDITYIPSFTKENEQGQKLAERHGFEYGKGGWMSLREYTATDGPKYVIIDEAHKLSGYYTDSEGVIKAFKGWSNTLRKRGGGSILMFIAQRWKSVHKQLRDRALMIYKPDRQTAEYYTDPDRAKRQKNPDETISGIPDTSWYFSTRDEAEFFIDADRAEEAAEKARVQAGMELLEENNRDEGGGKDELTEKDEQRIKNLAEKGVSQRDLAETFSISKGKVYNILQE